METLNGLHATDHWPKYNFAFLLESIDAESVSATLKSYIFLTLEF